MTFIWAYLSNIIFSILLRNITLISITIHKLLKKVYKNVKSARECKKEINKRRFIHLHHSRPCLLQHHSASLLALDERHPVSHRADSYRSRATDGLGGAGGAVLTAGWTTRSHAAPQTELAAL